MLHKLTSARTTEYIEAQDTCVDPLPFATDPVSTGKYNVGVDVILTSADGDLFLGWIADVEDGLRIYVELS